MKTIFLSSLATFLIVPLLWAQRPAIAVDVKAVVVSSVGDMTLQLYHEQAPRTVANFVRLAEQGFYNGLKFHRVVPGFLVQTGDPTNTGAGGPGYSFSDETNSLRHDRRGTLAMASRGPNTNGSQIYITLAPTPHLDRHHTVFGRVVAGFDTLERIGRVKTMNQRPMKPIFVKKVVIKADNYLKPQVETFLDISLNQAQRVTKPKARRVLSAMSSVIKLGKLREARLIDMSHQGSNLQVTYLATFDLEPKVNLVLAGLIEDETFEVEHIDFSLIPQL